MTTRLSEVLEITVHGVMMQVFGFGVLIVGEAGIGKSELALNLITRKHALIADDAINLNLEDGCVYASCPPILQNFLEVRGLGILDIEKLYGAQAIAERIQLDFLIRLVDQSTIAPEDFDRLQGLNGKRYFFDCPFLEIRLPVGAGRHLAVLLECAVKNFQLKKTGYDPVAVLRARQLLHLR